MIVALIPFKEQVAMQEEDFVQHLGQVAWGFGRVLVCAGDGKCRAIFTDGQTRTLDLKTAGAKLVPVARSEILADSPLLRTDWRAPKKAAAPKAKVSARTVKSR